MIFILSQPGQIKNDILSFFFPITFSKIVNHIIRTNTGALREKHDHIIRIINNDQNKNVKNDYEHPFFLRGFAKRKTKQKKESLREERRGGVALRPVIGSVFPKVIWWLDLIRVTVVPPLAAFTLSSAFYYITK